MPIFLWSTVVNQLQTPVVAVGRRRIPPRRSVVVTVAMGRSLQAHQVRHEGVDLVFVQLIVGHLRPELPPGWVAEPGFQGLAIRRGPVAAGEALVGRVREVRQLGTGLARGVGAADGVTGRAGTATTGQLTE